MAAAVARQEDEARTLELAEQKLVRGLAERRVDLDPARAAEAVDVSRVRCRR